MNTKYHKMVGSSYGQNFNKCIVTSKWCFQEHYMMNKIKNSNSRTFKTISGSMWTLEKTNYLLKSEVFPAMAAEPLELGVTENRDNGVICDRMIRVVFVVVTVVPSFSVCDVVPVVDFWLRRYVVTGLERAPKTVRFNSSLLPPNDLRGLEKVTCFLCMLRCIIFQQLRLHMYPQIQHVVFVLIFLMDNTQLNIQLSHTGQLKRISLEFQRVLCISQSQRHNIAFPHRFIQFHFIQSHYCLEHIQLPFSFENIQLFTHEHYDTINIAHLISIFFGDSKNLQNNWIELKYT